MKELDNLLKHDNIDYKSIESYITNNDNDDILFKIIHNIVKFNNQSQKQICENIIANTANKDLIKTTCNEISIFIPFDYDYYKKIIKLIISKNINENVIEKLEIDVLRNSKLALQEVFEDFSLEFPNDIDYDLSILQCLLHNYEEYSINLKNIAITKNQILEICKRLNYILTIEVSKILDLYFHFSNRFNFTEQELNIFLDKFIFNFPSTCKNFINNRNGQNDTLFMTYLKRKMESYDKDNKLKNNLKIYNPDIQRLNEYQKYLIMQNNEINDKSREMSVLWKLCKSNTILYGKRYGMTVKHKDGDEVSIGNMHEFSYEYPLPLEYLIDPITYMEKVNEIKHLGKEEK